MEILKAILLGIIQGLTEFLPVSSSGHLVIFQHLFNFENAGLIFDVAVHMGTLLAVFIVFREDIVKLVLAVFHIPSAMSPVKRDENPWLRYLVLDIYIIFASIPAAVIGIAFESKIESYFTNIYVPLVGLFITGLVMLSYKWVKEKNEKLTVSKSLLIGLAQAFAILPGISRSGSTIMMGIWSGINRETAAKFSFLMSIPVILGAGLLKFMHLVEADVTNEMIIQLIAGITASAISGYFAIVWLIAIIKKQKLEYFGYYCLMLSIIGIIAMQF